MQAESYLDGQGVVRDGQAVTGIRNGSSLHYRNIDFGPAAPFRFTARASCGGGPGVSGLLQVRIDSPTAAPVGTFAIADTGGWNNYRNIAADISGSITGVHDVYLTFTSGQPAEYIHLESFTFERI